MANLSVLIALFMTTAVLYFASPILIPFVLALFLAILLDPLVSFGEERGLSRRWIAPLVTIGFVATMALLAVLLYRSVTSLSPVAGLNTRFGAVVSIFDWIQSTYASLPKYFGANVIAGHVQKVQVVEATPAWTRYLVTGVGSLFTILTIVGFVPVLLAYLLSDKENLLESFNALAGRYVYLPRVNRDLPVMIRGFFSANIAAAVFMVFGHAVLLASLGFENWAPVAILSGLSSLLPVVGLLIALILPFINGVLSAGSEFPLWGVLLGISAIHVFALNAIVPVLAGSRVNLNSGAMMIGLLFWGWLWGATGVILAVPLTAILKTILESNPTTQPWANLLSARPKHVLAKKAAARPTRANGASA